MAETSSNRGLLVAGVALLAIAVTLLAVPFVWGLASDEDGGMMMGMMGGMDGMMEDCERHMQEHDDEAEPAPEANGTRALRVASLLPLR